MHKKERKGKWREEAKERGWKNLSSEIYGIYGLLLHSTPELGIGYNNMNKVQALF